MDPASRESILAALRAAISLDEPYGPPAGLPERVRIDRGKDFLSTTVAAALSVLAVDPLPWLPATEFAWFRADASRRLSRAEFARVDAIYRTDESNP